MAYWVTFLVPILFTVYLSLPTRRYAIGWVAGGSALVGLAVLTAVAGPMTAALSLIVGTLVLAALALLNITTRVSTLAIGIPMLGLPWAMWSWTLGGLILAAGWAAARLRSKRGKGFFPMLLGETMAALGSEGGDIVKPSKERLPVAKRSETKDASGESYALVRLPALLALSYGVGAITVTILH